MSQDNSQTCGNCHFGHALGTDLSRVVCFGAPPTPVLFGARQVGMKMEYHLENQRPVIAKTEPACAVWKQKIEIILGTATQQ